MSIDQPTESLHPRRAAYRSDDQPDCPHVQASGGQECGRECDRERRLGHTDFGAAAAKTRLDHRNGFADIGAEGHSRGAELAWPNRPGRGSAEDIGSPSIRTRVSWLLLRPAAPPPGVGVAVAASLIVIETIAFVLFKDAAHDARFGVIFLPAVVVVSMVWGLRLGAATSVLSAIVLGYVGQSPPARVLPWQPQYGVATAVFLFVAILAHFVASLARAGAAEANERRREANKLAEQQAALRRLATLVARGVKPSDVFSAVAEEMARCLGTTDAEVLRYEPDGAAIVVASWAGPGMPGLAVGERLTLEGDSVSARVLRTGRPARMDSYDDAARALAARVRALGLRSRVGAPIMVAEQVWGLAIVAGSRPEPLPADSEERVAEFADLVAVAIAAASTRAELIASRARIVAAADDARRRLERDLHDGAQQRLVSLGLKLRMAQKSVPAELVDLQGELSEVVSGLTGASHELQEISRGIHPAPGGLGPALQTLARRSAIPVTLDVAIDRRLPESVEVAAYYMVAEALANTTKHAKATEATVRAHTTDAGLALSVRDDGIGGADTRNGSGLIGLKDRIEALGGHLRVTSPPGSGTGLHTCLPLNRDGRRGRP
jgi:signal transduction histidine kinase